MPKITMAEFIKRVPKTLKKFEAATKEEAKTDHTFNPKQKRPEAWWWRDVAAYLNCQKLIAKAPKTRTRAKTRIH